jgi:membrane protease YdiL (CAAX protease family)
MSVPEPPADAAPSVAATPPRVWKFIGTSLWGLFAFGAMFVGQMAAVGWLLMTSKAQLDIPTASALLSNGLAISLSVVMGLPAVFAALWLATRMARMPLADYLALRGASWRSFLFGALALIVMIGAWDAVSRAMGREVTPGFMVEVLKSARADNALWLLVVSFCVAAPVTEEVLVRGFLYRGWSESFLRPVGAIVLSSVVWTAMHLQYDWFFFGEIFSIGLLLGYLRYRSGSIWPTIVVHGLNNLAATVQTYWLAN